MTFQSCTPLAPCTDVVSWEILGHGNVVRRLAQAMGIEELRRRVVHLAAQQVCGIIQLLNYE